LLRAGEGGLAGEEEERDQQYTNWGVAQGFTSWKREARANSAMVSADGHYLSGARGCRERGRGVSCAANTSANNEGCDEQRGEVSRHGSNPERDSLHRGRPARISGHLAPVSRDGDVSGGFNNQFTPTDWATSFFYNFMMWLTATWVFVLMAPGLLKAFRLMLMFFVSVSAIYMNHYAHSKWFYIWNSLGAVIVCAVVAVSNGLLYPRIFKEQAMAAGM
jgi:hypothetical protein